MQIQQSHRHFLTQNTYLQHFYYPLRIKTHHYPDYKVQLGC